ncbi:TRAP transporter fused permease subunit [Pararhodobacter sp. CCB-MM2]|uniref:TRAP transporter permease n=1 Tax=Pararhodobacter sp. CCB-MM2 TaxID=1786003 RepID=UPI00082BBCCB|nr:TRAP transporter fused permease subunit [Pararhodobacter sp. CCB-MM2]
MTTEIEQGTGLSRRIWHPMAMVLWSAITLTAIGWSLGLPRTLGISYYPQQLLAILLGLSVTVAFLSLPVKGNGIREGRLPWLDLGLSALALLATVWIVWGYPTFVTQVFARKPEVWLPGLVMVLLLLEALRRATGWALVIIIAVFLLYALFGNMVPGRLQGRAQNWQVLSGYMALDSNGILGVPMAVAGTVVVSFILFGQLLNTTGGSNFFTDGALLLMGRFRGGAMKIAVLASGLFGSISGSAVANVAGTGVVTVPMIKRDGYPAHKAAAIEAVASTGGQLMPPVMGAAAFLMAEFLGVSYAAVALAALAPAILYYVALFIQADLEAAKLGIAPVPADQIPPKRAVGTGLHFLLCFAVLIYTLFALSWQPERAAVAATVTVILSALLFGYRGERPALLTILDSVPATGRAVIEILLISGGSGLVIGVLNVTGLSFNLTYALVQLGQGNLIALLALSALVCIVLGMGLPTLGVYVLLAALVAPALIETGVEPIAAHLYVLYFGMMSMITPPIAMAAFAAASIAGARPMATGFAAMRFGWAAYLMPVLFVFSPSLLLIGPGTAIALTIATATIGVWLISAAIAGYMAQRLSGPMRALFALAGLLALVPADAFPGAVYSDVIGALGGLVLIAMNFLSAKGKQPVESGT